MSAGSDNIFARWSRRKQAVRDSETPPPDVEESVGGPIIVEAEIQPAEPTGQQPAGEPGAEVAEAVEPAEPLPRLEDLTAESDLSAFLREGVPKALKSAAMRKMWSLDPAIRDYIGPSEYAWDFNKPGSMAGFGPLDDAGEAVADFLSTMSGAARTGFVKAIAASPTPADGAASPEQHADASPHSLPNGPAYAAAQENPPEHPTVPANPRSPSLDRVAATDEPAEPDKPAGPSRSPAPPRHGSAMPRKNNWNM